MPAKSSHPPPLPVPSPSSGAPRKPPPPLKPSKPPPPPSSEPVSLLEDDKSSIDKLLALTDEGWDIDEQVRTLQIASGEPTSKLMRALPTGEMVLPSANELAPPPPKKASIPPPLPPQAREAGKKQSIPPPLPAKAVSPAIAKPPPPKKPPLPKPLVSSSLPPAVADSAPLTREEPRRERTRSVLDPMNADSLVELLAARISTLEAAADKVGVARAHVELAIASEAVLGDDDRAISHAELALAVDPSFSAAHHLLRVRKHGRTNLAAMLGHLDHELAASSQDAARSELLVQRARLLEALGGSPGARDDAPKDVLKAWQRALELAPHHAAALRGLESELAQRAQKPGDAASREAYANHLAVMADAYASDTKLAAWLHVERARLLEHSLHKLDAARGALDRALELDGTVGPVRDASVRFVAAHDDPSALASFLEEEALLER